MAHIELDLAHAYKPNPQRDEDYALLPLKMNFEDGGAYALLGPSGCGKTTLLRCLAGLQRAPVGRLVVAGETWQDARVFVPPHRRAVGLVFQEASLFPHLTVQGNLDYGRKRIAPAQRRVALDEAVALLDIGALLSRQPQALSGGERQRVAIARAPVRSGMPSGGVPGGDGPSPPRYSPKRVL